MFGDIFRKALARKALESDKKKLVMFKFLIKKDEENDIITLKRGRRIWKYSISSL